MDAMNLTEIKQHLAGQNHKTYQAPDIKHWFVHAHQGTTATSNTNGSEVLPTNIDGERVESLEESLLTKLLAEAKAQRAEMAGDFEKYHYPVNLRKRLEVAAPTLNVQDIMEIRELSRALTVMIRLQRVFWTSLLVGWIVIPWLAIALNYGFNCGLCSLKAARDTARRLAGHKFRSPRFPVALRNLTPRSTNEPRRRVERVIERLVREAQALRASMQPSSQVPAGTTAPRLAIQTAQQVPAGN
ncbi:MAG: hypothetical protein Q9221_006808 [Calogaya cf. arnoldii]